MFMGCTVAEGPEQDTYCTTVQYVLHGYCTVLEIVKS